MKQVSIETSKAISIAVRKTIDGQRAMGSAVDALYADGVTPELMMAPPKDGDRTFYASLERAVVAGFSATIQALLEKETKSLPEEKKSTKRYWQQQIGSKIKDLRNSLQRRIDKANADGDSDGANNTSTLEARIKRDLSKYVSQLEKTESFQGNVINLIKDLKSAIAWIK